MRLRWPYIVVAYALIAVLVVVGFWARQYRKQYAQMKELDNKIAEQQKVIDRRPQVERQLADAKAQLTRVKAEYQAIEEAKMPPLDFRDPLLGTMALWFEQREDLGPAILEFFAKSNIVPSGFSLPAPPTEPQSYPPGAFMELMPRTSITFTASLDQLLDFLYSFGEAKRIIATGDSISLAPADASGQLLQVTLPIAVYTFVRVPPGASLAAAAPAAGPVRTAGAAPGGRPGAPGAAGPGAGPGGGAGPRALQGAGAGPGAAGEGGGGGRRAEKGEG